MRSRAARVATALAALLATVAHDTDSAAQRVPDDEPYDHYEDQRERYALPATPMPVRRMPRRGGVELGVGVRGGADGFARVALSYGVFLEHIASDGIAFGVHLAYLGVDSDRSTTTDARGRSAFASTATLRWMPTTPRTMNGRRLGLRTGVGYRVIGGEANHFTIDATALVAFGRMAFGLRYQRAFATDSAARDTVLLVTERTTPTFTRSTRREARPVRVGLGMHVLSGWAAGAGLGPMPIGARVELPFVVGTYRTLIPTVAWELAWFPGVDAPRSALQTISAGVLHHRDGAKWIVGADAGYGHASGATPRAIASGPVAGATVYYLANNPGLFLGLHARAGVTPDNRELRVLLVSVGGIQIFR